MQKKSGNKVTGGDVAGGDGDSDDYSFLHCACHNSGYLLISVYHF